MVSTLPRTADRVESLIAATDTYEPKLLKEHADQFRLFARYVSRTIDGRYLEHHPPDELLPDLEQLMYASLTRGPEQIVVHLAPSDDGEGRRGVLMTCMPDQLFIYSTVRLALEYLGLRPYRSINAVVPIRRGATGEINAVAAADVERESFIWLEVESEDLTQRVEAIETYIHGRLEAAKAAVRDFHNITSVVEQLATRFEWLARERPDHRDFFNSNSRFLRWLLDEHFVFLGLRYLEPVSGHPGVNIEDAGVARFDDWRGTQIEDAERAVRDAGDIPPYLWVRKSHTESWTYRPGRMDHVLVQYFDPKGRPAGLVVLEGMFSYQALAEPRTDIPLLDRIIDQLFAQLQATKGSHRYRTIRNAFNSLPLEYLFSLQAEDIRQLVEQILDVDVEHRLQIHITRDDQQNFVFVFVALPRSHYSDELRSDIRRLLKETFRASSVDDGVYAGDVDSVTFHYFLTGASKLSDRSIKQLESQIEQMASPWSERLYDELRRRHRPHQARQLHQMYCEAFSPRFQEETSINRAVTDIEFLESLGDAREFDCDLYQEKNDKPLRVTRLRLYQSEHLLLSNILPILDNLGLIVIDEFPTTVQVPGRSAREISTFRLGGVREMDIDLLTRRNRLSAAIRAIVAGAMSNDSLNRLLLRADIPWIYVILVRALQHYARQIGFRYSIPTIQDALLRHAELVRTLTELFRAKFDPEIPGMASDHPDEKRRELVERTRRALLAQLEGIDDLTSDQVLRMFFTLVEATVRTNFYSRAPMQEHRLVLKLDPSKIELMPEPRPYREIYVHHPGVLGVHLRGGPIARGGIRWSDRLLDYRTEVLDLMATQNLKNVLIVPRGAKGGFVLRHEPADPTRRRQQAEKMYEEFIRGLLDVTDNRVGDTVVQPKRVIRWDAPDDYLVVAPDKGTAHLSDTANAIAAERGFWLEDAFASGGSRGYDHKKEAITARGAWECVKRHFREMGADPERDAIRVAGVGDMSGDVFGNGMLLSRSMQLIAAFDHRHIFIDPNPDPELSYQAREQLFHAGRTTWEDYPSEAISAGGGVYPRGAKAIRLQREAKAALGIDDEVISGQDLVKAVLRAPVDLLWNGGIGTYIKSSRESHLDVGDPANDSVRVNADEVRCRVLGEGGNLGVTSEGRIQLSENGVRLNSDAVDNSGGVDMSDHEVNLKVLFARPRQEGRISGEERDAILESIRDQISRKVLCNNWVQSRTLSLDELRSRRDPARFYRAISFLSERVPFNRKELSLPGERLIRQRMSHGQGLYRPELAALMSAAKIDLSQELGHSELFDLEVLSEYLFAYFPESVAERFRDDILNHPLAINIGRTMLTNDIVSDAGGTWLAETALRTGRPTGEIVQAYLRARELMDAYRLKRAVDAIETQLDAATEYRLRLTIEGAIEAHCNWLLRLGADIPAGYAKTFKESLRSLPQALETADADTLKQEASELHAAAVPEELAATIVVLERVDDAIDVAYVATRHHESIERASHALQHVGKTTGLHRLLAAALESHGETLLDRPARDTLREQLRHHLIDVSARVLSRETELKNISHATSTWLNAIRSDLEPLLPDGRELANLVIAVDRVARRLQMTP